VIIEYNKKMMNLINKSVKTLNSGISTFVNGITAENSYKTQIGFCKFDSLPLNFLRIPEKDKDFNFFSPENELYWKAYNVLYIVHSKVFLNIYYITDDLELKCIFTNKFNSHIDTVDSFSIGNNSVYLKEGPLIGLISNYSSINQNTCEKNQLYQQKNDSYLKIFSIKTKRVVHNLRFKKIILEFISKINFFALSFNDGSIKIYENESKMSCLMTINTWNQCDFLSENSHNLNSFHGKNYNMPSHPIFDLSESFVIYFNNNISLEVEVNEPSNGFKEGESSQPGISSSSIQTHKNSNSNKELSNFPQTNQPNNNGNLLLSRENSNSSGTDGKKNKNKLIFGAKDQCSSPYKSNPSKGNTLEGIASDAYKSKIFK
jgi:hypothetical protein